MAKAARILKMGYLEMKLPQKKGTWQLKWCIFCILDDNSTSFLDYFSNEESFRKGGKVASIRLDNKDKLSVTMDQKLKQNCLMVDNDKGPFGFFHKDPIQMAQWQKVFLFCLTPGEGVDLSQMAAGPGAPLPPLPTAGESSSDGPPPVPPIPPGHPMNAPPRLPGAPSPPPYPGGQTLPPALSGLPLPPLPTVSMSGPPLPPLPSVDHNYEDGTMSMFKVSVEATIDSKRLGLAGDYMLIISPEDIVVMEQKQTKDGKVEEHEILTWKLTTLRRFFMTVVPGEKYDQLLSIESGRRSSTGPGVFQFFTTDGDELYSCIRSCAIKGLELIKARKAALAAAKGQQLAQQLKQPGPPGPRPPGPPGPRQPGPPGPRQAGPPGPRQPGPPGPRQPGPPGPRQPGPGQPGPRPPGPPGPRQPGPPGADQAGPGKAQAPGNQQQPGAQKEAAKAGQEPPKSPDKTSPPKVLDRAEEIKSKGVIIDDGMNPVYGQGLELLPPPEPEEEEDESSKPKPDQLKAPMGHARNASNVSNLSFDLDPEFVAKANMVTANCKTEEDLDGLEQEFDLMKLLQSSMSNIEKDGSY